MSGCAYCEGWHDLFIKEEGGEYVCRQCIKEGEDLK